MSMGSFTPVLWITGLPASGKTSLALKLAEMLQQQSRAYEVLDGDEIRALYPQLGFHKEARDFHIRAVGHTAALLAKHGIIPIVALVSPYRDSRNFVRSLTKKFIEIYLNTPLAVCQARDPKHLYAKFARGELKGLTGLDAPYEAPEQPELSFDASVLSCEECAKKVCDYVGR